MKYECLVEQGAYKYLGQSKGLWFNSWLHNIQSDVNIFEQETLLTAVLGGLLAYEEACSPPSCNI